MDINIGPPLSRNDDLLTRAGRAVMSWFASDTAGFISDYVFYVGDSAAVHSATVKAYVPRVKQSW